MDLKQLTDQYPRLYHMAEPGSWPMIRQHGLLSTSALLDLFEARPALRIALERRHRPNSFPVLHPVHGRAVVRDQKPMSDSALKKCLQDGLTPEDWYVILNSKVFFWPTQERLDRLMGAQAYRDRRQTIIEVDSARLLAVYAKKTVLSPINSGSTIFNPQPRGQKTFLPIDEYPFAEWAKRRSSAEAVAEVAIEGGVREMERFVVRVTEEGANSPPTLVYRG